MKLFVIAALLLAAASVRADVPNLLSAQWSGRQSIPDNNASGVAFTFNLSPPGNALITGLRLDLRISGGWNGDLYAYLSHGGGFAVLLNRIGRSNDNPTGSGSSGMSIELSDAYAADIHNFTGPTLTGNFAPDGRNVNPFNALDSDPRTAFFTSFNGLNASGSWTLFFADVAPAADSTIQSWNLNIGVTAIPEPGTTALLALAGLFGILRYSNRSSGPWL